MARWLGLLLLVPSVVLAQAPDAETKAKRKPAAKASPPDAGVHYVAPNVPFQWDVPKVVAEVQVPALMETNGIPNRFHVVVVGLPIHEAYNHFLRHFMDSGLWVAPPHEQVALGDGQMMLTAFHPADEISYSVILAPQKNGRTQVIMGEAFWKDRTFAPSFAFAPVYAGAEALLTQDLETGRALQYRVRATLPELTTFYEGALGQAGWKRQGTLWVRGAESLHLLLNPSKDASGYVDVAVVEAGPPPEPAR